MKISVMLAALALIALASCKKDEDNGSGVPAVPTNPTVVTGDSTDTASARPTITILQPIAQIEADGNQIKLEIDFTDPGELISAIITLQSTTLSGAVYFTQERGLSGKSDKLTLNANLPKLNSLGDHLLVVRAKNGKNKEKVVNLDFKLTDSTKPIVKLNNFYADLSQNPGTPHSKFDYTASDNYGIKSILKEIIQTDANGKEFHSLYSKTHDFPESGLTLTHTDDKEIDPVSSSFGYYYKGKLTVTDVAGNQTVVETAVKQF